MIEIVVFTMRMNKFTPGLNLLKILSMSNNFRTLPHWSKLLRSLWEWTCLFLDWTSLRFWTCPKSLEPYHNDGNCLVCCELEHVQTLSNATPMIEIVAFTFRMSVLLNMSKYFRTLHQQSKLSRLLWEWTCLFRESTTLSFWTCPNTFGPAPSKLSRLLWECACLFLG